MIRIAINGYGRIGRSVLRALYESQAREHVQVIAINEPADSKTRAQVQRIFDKQIAAWNAGDLNTFMKGYWEDE